MKLNILSKLGAIAAFAIFMTISLASCENQEPAPEPTQDEIEARWPETIEVEGLGTFVKVQRDTFTMGTDNGLVDEAPAHDVTFSKSYYMGIYEVTQGQWKSYMNGNNPSDSELEGSIGDNLPVNNITVAQIQEFITAIEAATGRDFELPTEAQWEWAAMGGVKSQGYEYAGSNDLDQVAWFLENNPEEIPHAVGQKAPNELGLYDMSGNVAEWCSDRYRAYPSSLQTDPAPSSGSKYNQRGGTFDNFNNGEDCRVKARSSSSQASYNVGFRLVLVAPLDSELLPEQ